MKKLDYIPKKDPFEAPDGYFDKLPGVIQSRVATERPGHRPVWTYRLAYASAVLLVAAVAGIFWFSKTGREATVEDMLASVQTEELVAYLSDSDMSTDELLEDVSLSSDDALE